MEVVRMWQARGAAVRNWGWDVLGKPLAGSCWRVFEAQMPAGTYQRPRPRPGSVFGASHGPVTVELRRSGRGFVMLSVHYLPIRLVLPQNAWLTFLAARRRDAQQEREFDHHCSGRRCIGRSHDSRGSLCVRLVLSLSCPFASIPSCCVLADRDPPTLRCCVRILVMDVRWSSPHIARRASLPLS